MRVLAALSGGVDSAVAAARAVEAGHEVVGVHMALSRQRAQSRSGSRGCCSIEDASDARWAAQILGIPFYVWDLSEEFEDLVVADFLAEYRAGRTPNPCVRCNERVKFDVLLSRALAMGFDAVATGHYARLEGGAAAGRPGDARGLELSRAADGAKDQSYVLAVSGRQGLARALFPLGDAPSKAAVRAEARARGLPVAAKPDSYDICFVADGDTRGFLSRSLGVREGAMVSPDGEVLGSHEGYFGFTVGQRKGLGLDRPAPDGRPRYVIETRPATNEVVVGPAELLSRSRVEGTGLVLLADPEGLDPTGTGGGPRGWRGTAVQVRAHGRAVPADVVVDERAATLVAELHEPLRGLAAGQSVVVYGGPGGDRVLAQATLA
ncbi:tRNA 2-thiouridine(34) synthase MnmA [Actinomyces bowdenii]|uniref:tRNA-specific 2-thiouridylase MnmA n=1 Tax=Actinomyces bowdenii TaxID=131109 RepID=A0A3P1UXF5_9ACTO|nr:tRNA 2-thiouridine(34) synthase MnmA [Actinomyces bowdenii]MBO3724890.1 tRNA 2-thiouridine(34) synthase MnmA [Actinomyces bowdenii]RRD26097.1 tRNA 2-thiouridine(34) synthase MnmA [Actinomyces bowdenii]